VSRAERTTIARRPGSDVLPNNGSQQTKHDEAFGSQMSGSGSGRDCPAVAGAVAWGPQSQAENLEPSSVQAWPPLQPPGPTQACVAPGTQAVLRAGFASSWLAVASPRSCLTHRYAVPLTVAVDVVEAPLEPLVPKVGGSCCTKFAPRLPALFRKSFMA
jgi:hypothetical protein